MRTIVLAGFTCVLMIACADRAKADFDRCMMLAARAHEGDLQDAVTACTMAVALEPNSTSGKAAAAKLAELQPKLNVVVPETVTMEWCERLRNRLQTRLSSDALVKYGGAGGDVGTIIHDNVLNVEYNCRQAEGQPTAGLWACRWNETLDTGEQCDAMEKRQPKGEGR